MNNNLLTSTKALSDADLLSHLAAAARLERGTTVELIAHLAELDARKLYRAEGYGSLFRYCTQALSLSEHAAYGRIQAVHIARQFPVVLDRLAEGSLNLTTLGLIGPHLRPENHLQILDRAAGGSKRDVEILVAGLAPRPDVPASVRKLPGRDGGTPEQSSSLSDDLSTRLVPQPEPVAAPSALATAAQRDPGADGSLRPDPLDTAGPDLSRYSVRGMSSSCDRPLVAPLAPERYRIQFTMGQETHDNLRLAQDLLRREIPDGDPAAIFDRALRLLLSDTVRKKIGAVSSPRHPRKADGSACRQGGVSASRHIPTHVKQEVWIRDRGQCAFLARNGRRCAERSYLEFHHVQPFALDGEATTRNVSLRCRAHNVYEGELVFGRETMARHSSAERATRSGPSCRRRHAGGAPNL